MKYKDLKAKNIVTVTPLTEEEMSLYRSLAKKPINVLIDIIFAILREVNEFKSAVNEVLPKD